MDATVVVAVAGIGGTLLAAVLSPFVTARMGRKNALLDRLTTERLTAYADLLRATARLADNAMNWSAIPLADLEETDNDEMDRLIAQARVVASRPVYERLGKLTKDVHEFNLQLHMAKLHHQQLAANDLMDDGESLVQRMALSEVAERITEAHKELESAIRKGLQD